MARDTGMEEFNEETQRAKVGAGFKGGMFFQKPLVHPAMSIVNGVPKEVEEKFQFGGITQGTPDDPWGYRNRNK